jgi:hypothetical protein
MTRTRMFTNTNPPRATVGGTRGLRLPEVGERLHADDMGKWDTLCRRDDLQMREGQLIVPRPEGSRPLELSTWASGQMCSRLGIPVSYFRKCPAELQDAQANHWLQANHGLANLRSPDEQPEESCSCGTNAWEDGGRLKCRCRQGQTHASSQPERWRLRAKDETLRAVVSDRYAPLDNSALWEQLRNHVPARYKVDWLGLSEESLHLRLVDLERCREVLPGDDLTIGIHIANSEVGGRALSVEALIHRLVCTNGLIRRVGGKSLLRQRHIHISTLRLEAALAEATHRALEEAEEFLNLLKTATRTPLADVDDAIEQLGSRWNLPMSTQGAVRKALLQEIPSQQETLYGLINAFTYSFGHARTCTRTHFIPSPFRLGRHAPPYQFHPQDQHLAGAQPHPGADGPHQPLRLQGREPPRERRRSL